MLIEKGNPRSTIFAFAGIQHQTFCRTLHTPGTDDGPVKARVIQKNVESGLCYKDVQVIFKKAGIAGLGQF